MFRKLTRLYDWISYLGVTDKRDYLDQFRKMVLNRTFFIVGMTCLIIAIQGLIAKGIQDLYIPLCVGLLTFSALSLNYFKQYLIARSFLMVFYPLLLLAMIYIYGSELRLEYTISLFLVFTFIFYDSRQWRIIIIGYLLLIQFLGYYYTSTYPSVYSDRVDRLDSLIILLGTTLGLALLVRDYVRENKILLLRQQSLNHDLNEKNEALESSVREKIQLNEKLLEKTRELQRSNEFLESYTYIASHDMKTPIRTVSSFSKLLEKQLATADNEDVSDYLKFISMGIIQLNAIVDGIVENAQNNRSNLQIEVVDCMELMQLLEQKLEMRIQEIGGRLVFKELPRIHADRNMLAKVFYSLIDNGFKYNKHIRPIVEVSYHREAGRHEFAVSDNGIGISPQYGENIFKMFKKLHPKQDFHGSGVGLALCKKIIELHHGEIWLDTTIQSGSTFRFSLPISIDFS